MVLPKGKVCNTVETALMKKATDHQAFLFFLPISYAPATKMTKPIMAMLKIPGNRPFGFPGLG
jgi:hypothetical protein